MTGAPLTAYKYVSPHVIPCRIWSF